MNLILITNNLNTYFKSGNLNRTVASALNSLAAIACQDFLTGLLGITLPENKGALVGTFYFMNLKNTCCLYFIYL